MKKFNLLFIIFIVIAFVSSLGVVLGVSSNNKQELSAEEIAKQELQLALENTNNSTNFTIDYDINVSVSSKKLNVNENQICKIKLEIDDDAICINLNIPFSSNILKNLTMRLYGYKQTNNQYVWYYEYENIVDKIDDLSDIIEFDDLMGIETTQLTVDDFNYQNGLYYANENIINQFINDFINRALENFNGLNEQDFEIDCNEFVISIKNNYIDTIKTNISFDLSEHMSKQTLNTNCDYIMNYNYFYQFSAFDTTSVPSVEELMTK